MAVKSAVPQRLKKLENQVVNLSLKIVDQDRTLKDQMAKVNGHGNLIYELQHPPERTSIVNTLAAESPGPARKSSMQTVQERVCFQHGHLIGQLERQVPNTELADPTKAFHKTTVLKQEILCLKCGMTLDEIRRAQ